MSTVLLTGSTSGLGRRVAFGLVRAGHTVIAHGRDGHRTAKLVAELDGSGGEARAVVADLASLAEARALGQRVAQANPRLDVLVNNAEVGSGRTGAHRQESAEGHELRMAVNCLAPMELTRALLPTLRANAPARIVNVGAAAQEAFDPADIEFTAGYEGGAAYRRSKYALTAYTFELAGKLAGRGVTANVLHPAAYPGNGPVGAGGAGPVPDLDGGAAAVLALAVGDAGAGHSGEYFDGLSVGRALPEAYDGSLRARLLGVLEPLLP